MRQTKSRAKNSASLSHSSLESSFGFLDSLIGWNHSRPAHSHSHERLILASEAHLKELKARLKGVVEEKHKDELESFKSGVLRRFSLKGGGEVFVLLRPSPPHPTSHEGLLEESPMAFWRKQGPMLLELLSAHEKDLRLDLGHLSHEELVGLFLGLGLGAYRFLKVYRPVENKESAKVQTGRRQAVFLMEPQALIKQAYAEALTWVTAQNWARHLVNLPAAEAYPLAIAGEVEKVFSKLPGVRLRLLKRKDLEREGMGLLLGVGNSSEHEPCLVHLEYIPRPKTKKTKAQHIALVGKGVTFDTGGLDIKPSSAMRLMKKDMAGAAAVLGVMYYVAKQELPISVSAFVPLAENAIGPKAMRPGDVLKSRKGLLVEIHNTDAEGRLLLADAMDYALSQTPKPSVIVDLATLTGAIKSTLGLDLPGLFCNHDTLAHELLRAAQRSGDLVWRVPLYSPYGKALKGSSFADLVNCTDGWGTPVTAALFLNEFVGNTPWAHIDMYGWQDKPQAPFAEAGANGQGVSVLVEWFKGLADSSH